MRELSGVSLPKLRHPPTVGLETKIFKSAQPAATSLHVVFEKLMHPESLMFSAAWALCAWAMPRVRHRPRLGVVLDVTAPPI